MPKLRTVNIRRFKRLKDLTVNLDDVTLLVGANNAGKSSVLQAIHFAASIAQSAKLIGERLAWQQDKFELSFNPSQLLYSPGADVLSLASGGVLQEPRESQIEFELIEESGERCVVGLRRGRNRNIAVSLVGRSLGERLMDLRNPYTVYAPGLAGVPKDERYLSPGVVRRVVARGDANLTLRNVLRMLARDEEGWNSFLENMRFIFGPLTVEIQFDEDVDESVEVFFSLNDGPRLRVDAAGTSVLQASQILAYIELFKPRLLILDEPDSHLHPNNQRNLCSLVFQLAARNGFQALISTHSRHVLDAMKGNGTVVWLAQGRKVEDADLKTTSLLLALGAFDSIDYFANGRVKCVVATEDRDTEPLKALLWSNGFDENETEVAAYAGCSKADAAVVLGKFLRSRAPNIKTVVHRDQDYADQDTLSRFERSLADANLHAFYTDGNDIEYYFISAAHLHQLNPEVSQDRIENLIEEAIAECKDQTLKSLVEQRTEAAFRARNRGGPSPDHGRIAVEATRDIEENPRQYARGKLVLSKLKGKLQTELRSNPRIFDPSSHLRSDKLMAIAQQIWPPGSES